MRWLYFKKKHVTIADNWNELTQKQYISIAKILHSDVLSDDAKMLSALQVLLKYSTIRFLLLEEDFIVRCLPHVTWIFERDNITAQLIPKYKSFYGPAGEFDNLIGKEFHCTEIAYQEVIRNNDAEALNRLCAFLYRPKKHSYDMRVNKDGDVRVLFNPNECLYHAQRVRRWKPEVKQAILLWYDGCRQMLVKSYPLAFGKGKENGNYYEGLFGMMRSIAGEKYGTLEDVENLYVHTMFMEIVACKKEEREMEKMVNG
jgi:hypothetical protein